MVSRTCRQPFFPRPQIQRRVLELIQATTTVGVTGVSPVGLTGEGGVGKTMAATAVR